MNPFTYQFFLSAIHSYDDKMLMYFIDEAVGIYCNLTGKAVGPRPASPKDYKAEYADAYEVANYAVFIVARKMGSYNPQEEFRPYLRKALENAIKDILKEDGEGDFFNKTAHKKKKRDEEPEQHQRVNIDSFYSPDRESPEPDSEASERAGRIMKHSNDALEAMIKFVDSLPEMKRAALYASAFGQALRPDLENYGRNYADILAGIYNTTAIYIRKLADQGKKAALAEVRRQGFSESSMAEVSMGYIQARTPVQDINDKVLKAVSELDSYQQFMFLRHLAGTGNGISSSGNNSPISFVHKTENNAFLTPSQEKLLDDIEGFTPFPFAGLSSFRELRQRTGVSVIISDRNYLCKVLDDCIKRINEIIADYNNNGAWRNPGFGENVENEIYRRLEWAKGQREIAGNPKSKLTPLLGLYSRKLLWFDSENPAVYLFADNIKDYAERKSMPSEHVFGFVFVHEMMHAYYDAFNSFGFPAKERLEEAFAEFGMLTFIEQSFGIQSQLFANAQVNVEDKIKNGPREYGFGLDLYKMSSGRRTDMVDRYKDISNWIDNSIINKDFPSKGLGNYFKSIADYCQGANESNRTQCFDNVKGILNYQWPMPALRPQPSVISTAVFKPSPIRPNPLSKCFSPLTVCRPKQAIRQYTVIKNTDVYSFIEVLIRLLKLVGVEPKLSFDNSRTTIVYSGKPLFYFSQTPPAQSMRQLTRGEVVMEESLCVNGVTVYPRTRLHAGLCSRLVCILSDIVGTEFYLIGPLGKDYALYGPELCAEYKEILFPKQKEKRYDKCSYEISYRATSEVLGKSISMYEVPLIVLKHFCETNKDITWGDLQRIFCDVDSSECHFMGPFCDWITPKIIVDAVSAFYKQRPMPFHPTPITLGSGDTLLVTIRWAFMPDAFLTFLKEADSLGYDIREE